MEVEKMKRCGEFVYSICPDRFVCGNREDAVFMEGSECDEFNEEQDVVVFRLREVVASCAEHAANTQSWHMKEIFDSIARGLEGSNAED